MLIDLTQKVQFKETIFYKYYIENKDKLTDKADKTKWP